MEVKEKSRLANIVELTAYDIIVGDFIKVEKTLTEVLEIIKKENQRDPTLQDLPA